MLIKRRKQDVLQQLLYSEGHFSDISTTNYLSTWLALPVIGGHHEVEQQPDGLLHIDLVGGGQPLVELVVDGRQDGLQPRHIDLSVVVQRVEAVVTKGFDHVPDIHQMNCANRPWSVHLVRLHRVITNESLRICGHLRLHLFCTNRSLQAVL